MSKKVDSQKNQRIHVFARCRPLNSIEKRRKSPSVVEVIPEKKEILLKDRNANREFFFDKVFPPDTKQITVYKAVVGPLIQEVLNGYNCTVFAYGQTGTGKTYTMEGERNETKCSWEDDPAAGIIPRALHQLFEELGKEENVEFTVGVSFLELYNEELYNLLGSTGICKLKLYDDEKGRVVIKDLKDTTVNNKDEVYSILEKGSAMRQTAATLLNATSSRSHTVFSVTVHIKENTVDGEELLKIGKLNLVDLAGSENIGRSGAIDKRAREAGNINQSLLTLGRVITSLIEKQPHIPYRESKLTRLLQDSLGGHTKTSIIATISPALCNFDETISTLDYATKAKSITVRPEVNQKMTKRALIKEYTEEIKRLQNDLAAARNNEGYYISKDSHDNYETLISEKEDKIKNLVVKVETLQEENRKIEELFHLTKEKLEKTCEQLDETTQKYENTELELSNTSNALVYTQEVLTKTALDRDEKEYLINVKEKAENKLSHQAQMLLQVADETTNDVHKLHEKIDRKKNVEEQNENSCLNFRIMHQRQCAELDDIITEHKEKDIDFLQSIKGDLDHFVGSVLEYKQQMSTCLHQISTNGESNLRDFSSNLNSETSNERHWASDLLQNINSKKDTHVEDEQKFLTEKIPLHFNQLDIITSEAFNLFQDQYNNLCQKINQKKNAIEAQKAKEKDLIHSINDGLDSFLENHQAVVDNFTKQSKLALLANRENNKKLEKIAAELFQINKEEREGLLKLEECGQKFTDVRGGLKPVKENIVLLENEMNREDLSEFDTITNKTNLHEIFEKKKTIQETQLSVSSEVTKMLESSTKNKIEIVEELETAFENRNSEIVKTSEANQNKISDIITSLSETVEAANQYVEKCHESLRSSTEETSDKVIQAEKRQNQMTSEVKDKILKLHLSSEKFLSEDLAKDVATGDTPQRKTFTYPKDLVEFSPVDRVLERFRSQRAKDTAVAIHLPLDTSFNESEESKDTTQEDLGSGVTSHNTSFTNDGYDSADSNASSVSDIGTESNKNKENCRNNKNSRLPKKVPKFKGFAKPAPVSRRKPLTNTNSEVDSSNI